MTSLQLGQHTFSRLIPIFPFLGQYFRNKRLICTTSIEAITIVVKSFIGKLNTHNEFRKVSV